MARRISRLQLRAGNPPASQTGVEGQQKASRRHKPKDLEREIELLTIRQLAKEKGLPSGFRYIPKELQLKKDMEDLAISDIVDELYPESFIEKFNRNY